MLLGDLVTVEAAQALPEDAKIVDEYGFQYVGDGRGFYEYPVLGLRYHAEELIPDDGPFRLVYLPNNAILE